MSYLAWAGIILGCCALLYQALAILVLLIWPHRNAAWLLPVRDAISFAVWLGSYLGRDIHWRGRSFILNRDGHLQDGERIA